MTFNTALLLFEFPACAVLPSRAILQQRCTVAVAWVAPFGVHAVPVGVALLLLQLACCQAVHDSSSPGGCHPWLCACVRLNITHAVRPIRTRDPKAHGAYYPCLFYLYGWEMCAHEHTKIRGGGVGPPRQGQESRPCRLVKSGGAGTASFVRTEG